MLYSSAFIPLLLGLKSSIPEAPVAPISGATKSRNEKPKVSLGIVTQWHSQDIVVARAQHGHTTFVRTSALSAEAYRGVWGHPPRSVLRPYTVAKCKSLTAKLAYDERIRLDRNLVLYTLYSDDVPFDFKTI